MRYFNVQRLSALFLGITASTAIAAEVSLKGDAKLSGDIRGIAADGTITLFSPNAKQPLILNANQVERVDFGNAGKALESPEHRIVLSNGDIFPVTVKSMEGDLFHVDSPILGPLSIPRDAVSSLQFGIVPKKLIYAETKGMDGWSRDKGGWKYKDGCFFATGQGSLTRDVKLPAKFILKFTCGWQKHSDFQFIFAQSFISNGARQDRYIAQFTDSLFGVFRETSDRVRTPLILLTLTPHKFEEQSMDLEIRVDRTRRLLEVHIDGVLLGRYSDPLEPIPQGTFVSIVSNVREDRGQYFQDINILDWDVRGDRHRSEEKSNGKTDLLIGRNGERFSGKFEGVRVNGLSTVYVFKSDFQKEALEIPEEEVSTLFFRGQDKPSRQEISGSLILGMSEQASMRVSSCIVEGDFVKVEHHLLGSLKFARHEISSLELIQTPKATPVKQR